MHRNIYAYTAPGSDYPAFVSLNDQNDGTITFDARGPVETDGKCGQTIRIIFPVKELALLGKALINEVIPADLA